MSKRRYETTGKNSKSFINALEKCKRELRKCDFDKAQLQDIVALVGQEYLLTKHEVDILSHKVEKYNERMNDLYSLPFDEFYKIVEKS